jgi:peptide deformylase
MAVRNIRLSTDEILRKKSKEVLEITPRIITLLDDMLETMEDYNGVGLAAPQVGVLKRVIIINVGDGLIELINPVIEEALDTQKRVEGCLSIPGKTGVVKRPSYIKVKGVDRYNKEVIIEATELLAIALSHEIDHLNGVLFTDKIEEEQN